MGIRKIMTVKEPCLHKVCRPVEKFDGKLHKLLDDMKETLSQANGVGLAAPQVGIIRRACIVMETNVPEGEDEYFIELVNPEIIERDGEQEGGEQCVWSSHGLIVFVPAGRGGLSGNAGADSTASAVSGASVAPCAGVRQITMLMILPGTTMTFFGALPSSHFCASGCVTTSAWIWAGVIDVAYSFLKRSLPLTETGYSKALCARCFSS